MVSALDLRLDGREFNSRSQRLILDGWVTVFGRANHLSISPSHPSQLSLLPSSRREMSTGQSAVMLCGWGLKAGNGSFRMWWSGWQVKLCDPSLTRAIPERFRDEYRTYYKALYKCPVCLLTHGTIEGTTSTGTVHTSAKARLTSVAISVPPYAESVRDDESGKQSLYPDGDRNRHQHLTVSSLAHCQPSLKISSKSVRKFLRKVANRQTNKQPQSISFLVEGII